MQIEYIVCPEAIENKLVNKHSVTVLETRQVLLNNPRFRFAEHGYIEGEDVYVAFGQTFGGRYLSVFFIYKPDTKTAMIISAREMTKKERKSYGKK